MDTKVQSLPITRLKPHSNSRSQNHTCAQCSCSHHCQGCSQSQSHSRSRSRSSSQNPALRCSPTSRRRPTSHRSLGLQNQSPSLDLPQKNLKRIMPSHLSPTRSSALCNKKALGRKVNKGTVKTKRYAHKTKRRSSGRHAGRKHK